MNRIQELELEILKATINFCQKNKIEYFLCGGSLLGAVRHQGFIPWDDDIDIGMTRENYEKFINCAKVNNKFDERYEIQAFELENTNYPFAKVVDKKIEILKTHSVEDKNLYIDVFPFDFLPNDINKVKKIYRKSVFYKKSICYCNIDEDYLKERKKNPVIKFIEKIGYYGIVKHLNIKKITEKSIACAKKYNNSSEYVGCIVWGYGACERMHADDFQILKMKFENIDVNGIVGYDSYLKGLYGDYMQLPPENKRISHEIEIIELN